MGGGSENSLRPPRPSLGQGTELTPCPILPGAEVWLILGTSGQHKLFPSPGTGSTGRPGRGHSEKARRAERLLLDVGEG